MKIQKSTLDSTPLLSGTAPLLGTTLLGLAASAPSVEAQIIYTPVTLGGTISAGQSLYFDLGETGGPGSLSTSSFGNADFKLAFLAGFGSDKPVIYSLSNRAVAGSGRYLQRLNSGDPIGSGLPWDSQRMSISYTYGHWQPGQRGYAGLRIGAGPSFQYAWADIQYTSGRQLELFGFAVETAQNTPIAAAAVPEPRETALVMALLAGSVGLFLRRQQAGRS